MKQREMHMFLLIKPFQKCRGGTLGSSVLKNRCINMRKNGGRLLAVRYKLRNCNFLNDEL